MLSGIRHNCFRKKLYEPAPDKLIMPRSSAACCNNDTRMCIPGDVCYCVANEHRAHASTIYIAGALALKFYRRLLVSLCIHRVGRYGNGCRLQCASVGSERACLEIVAVQPPSIRGSIWFRVVLLLEHCPSQSTKSHFKGRFYKWRH